MYKIEGRSVISDKGKAVAALSAEGVVVFEPGMAAAHKNRFCEWLRANGATFGNLPDPEPAAAAAPAVPAQTVPDAPATPAAETKPEEKPVSVLVIADIPEEMLPEFDRRLGMDTPRLREYIKHHKLDAAQTAALVRRLERKQ